MNLMRGCKPIQIRPEVERSARAVFQDGCAVITGAEAGIETGVKTGGNSAGAGEEGVRDAREV